MEEFKYIQEILDGLGLAIDEKNNSEIIINFPIKYDKKNMKFLLSTEYKIFIQPLGTFLTDFLNADFSQYSDFLNFFTKYSLSLLGIDKIQKNFRNGYCSKKDFDNLTMSLFTKKHTDLKKLQEQLDMIFDYCLLDPNKKALNFTPIQRLYVLARISPNLTILTSHNATYYKACLFSSFPGSTENDIYEFLNSKKNSVKELDFLLPNNISAILYYSISSVLKEEIYLKTCKNCNRYFIAKNKATDYCDTFVNENKKTCQEIGRLKVFHKQKNSDPTLSLYYKIYNRKSMMKSRNPDIKKYIEDFEHYRVIGKKKLERYKKGSITSDEFVYWIERNI